jgi:DNA-binding XRE family transcriptional regulator
MTDASNLRAARIARGLSRQALAELTKLSPRVIADIEEGRLDRLPAGIYARSYVRTYAHAVGVDDQVVQSIVDALPAADVELEAMARCRGTPAVRIYPHPWVQLDRLAQRLESHLVELGRHEVKYV